MSPERKSWTAELIRAGLGIFVAGVVAYFTTTAAIQAKLVALEATQASQFQELLRRLQIMQDDIRELRRRE